MLFPPVLFFFFFKNEHLHTCFFFFRKLSFHNSYLQRGKYFFFDIILPFLGCLDLQSRCLFPESNSRVVLGSKAIKSISIKTKWWLWKLLIVFLWVKLFINYKLWIYASKYRKQHNRNKHIIGVFYQFHLIINLTFCLNFKHYKKHSDVMCHFVLHFTSWN